MAVKAVTPANLAREGVVAAGATVTMASGDDITVPTLHNLHLRVANSTTAGSVTVKGVAPWKDHVAAISASEVAYYAITDVTGYRNATDGLIHVTVPVGATVEAFSAVA